MSLKEYGKKRKLRMTPEPGPGPGKSDGRHLVFMVHKHAASRLHYDLRLELNGVLISFAVPKGPSLDPSVKRLAVKVEDHPFDYRNFEGVIPEGNYGAGTVMIWDSGFYAHPSASTREESEKLLAEGLKKGDLKFIAAGTKLKGEFALVKTSWDEKSWLLLKKQDAYVSREDILKKDRSSATLRSMRQIASDDQPDEKKAPKKTLHPVKPMLAASAPGPFNRDGWLFEIKWDGYRALAQADKSSVSLYSRNLKPLNARFPAIVSAVSALKLKALLDGEIVAIDKKGVPVFSMLHDGSKRGRLVYYVFDILNHNGRDLTNLPLLERKKILQKLLPQSGAVRVSGYVTKDGAAFFSAVRKKGLEGMVAKNMKSAYRPGIRSRDWLKVKNTHTQDCVVAGFTKPRGSRKYFGSLILGAYKRGKLAYIGHSGGGFSAHMLRDLHGMLIKLSVKKCPFSSIPPDTGNDVTWVRPKLVCEMQFTEWTSDSVLRHPVFIRMRDDKNPRDAVIEGGN